MPIKIHDNEYYTVAERIKEAGNNLKSVNSEVLAHNPVVVKVTITTDRGTFTGISAANPSKIIEKNSPYEVAETSALGRALGFSRYGLSDQIASAEEMQKVGFTASPSATKTTEIPKTTKATTTDKCPRCGAPMKLSLRGTQYCSALCWKKPNDIPELVVEDDAKFTAF